MSHLGSLVSALVDGQLPPADAERALAHVAACPACAEELAGARRARHALSRAEDVAPAPELTARLLALGSDPASPAHPVRPAPDRRRAVVPLGESAFAVPAKALSGDLVGRRPRDPRVLAGALTGAGLVVVSLLVLGEAPLVTPPTHPADALTALSRAPLGDPAGRRVNATVASTTADVRGVGAATDGVAAGPDLEPLWEQGWTEPERLPPGYDVSAVRVTGDDDLLELDLVGPLGRMVLTEQRGRLDVGSLGPVEERRMGGRTVYVVSRHPWHAVWQAGDTVVSVVSEAPEHRVAAVVDAFPRTGYDDGIPARLERGWDTLTGALAYP